MKHIARRYRECWSQERFVLSLIFSTVFLIGAFVVNIYAIQFATSHASNAVSDIILSNTPVYDVDGLFVYGTFVVVFITALILLHNPKYIPFVFNSVAVFYLIRSGLTSLTHIGPFAQHTTSDFGTIITRSFFGSDRFFSAHTGLPFGAALIFWHYQPYRYFYLAVSVFFGVVVLLGHLHYSIDVLSAFFITYSIYHLALWLFPREHALFIAQE